MLREMVEEAERIGFAFQFSIGDALTTALPPDAVSTSFNSLLEMQSRSVTDAEVLSNVSILYWRCGRIVVLNALPLNALPVSILYWRCAASAAVTPSDIFRDCFNSLLEMQMGFVFDSETKLWRVSILYWRCANVTEPVVTDMRPEGFNSLLEMRLNRWGCALPTGCGVCFNSLLEMPRK